jgi:hypothetical protein
MHSTNLILQYVDRSKTLLFALGAGQVQAKEMEIVAQVELWVLWLLGEKGEKCKLMI